MASAQSMFTFMTVSVTMRRSESHYSDIISDLAQLVCVECPAKAPADR